MVCVHYLTVVPEITITAESIIDGIPHPELRDRMILLRGLLPTLARPTLKKHTVKLHLQDILIS